MKFIPGLELNQKYYSEVVAPLIGKFDPKLNYSAGLIGYGSDVLGYDSTTSMDHNWGPRLQLFLEKNGVAKKEFLDEYLRANLPGEFLGFSTNFTEKGADGTQRMSPNDTKRVNHLVEIYDIDEYFFSIFHKGITEYSNLDWLCIPEQKLVEITSGSVFFDGLNKLEKMRAALKYYPQEVKLTRLAAYWQCISNEEAFIGRSNELSDLLGEKIIASRLVSYLLKICFVVKEVYIPYSKWFTHKFDDLHLPEIKALALNTLKENDPKKIEELLAGLYLKVLALQNSSSDIPKIERGITTYYNRPYKVILAGDIVKYLRNAITDNQLRAIDLNLVGIDNKIDSNDFTNSNLIERLIRGA
jgi:hypothetical protein